MQHINDDEGTKCLTGKFADDMKLGVFEQYVDTKGMQMDQNRLNNWGQRQQIKYNV